MPRQSGPAMTAEALASKLRRREEMLEEYDKQIERLRAEIELTTRSAAAERSKAIAAEAENRSLREQLEAAQREAKEAAEEAERARLAARAKKEADAKPALLAMSVPVEERSMNEDKALLAWVETVSFFKANARNDRMRRHICNSLECVVYQPTEPIVTQGETGDAFYVILSGTVQILVSTRSSRFSTLEPLLTYVWLRCDRSTAIWWASWNLARRFGNELSRRIQTNAPPL